jgi:hypothetical protein
MQLGKNSADLLLLMDLDTYESALKQFEQNKKKQLFLIYGVHTASFPRGIHSLQAISTGASIR